MISLFAGLLANPDMTLSHPSAGYDVTSAPVVMFVNSSELRAADFPLAEVRPLHLDALARGDRRTCYARRGSEKASGCR